MTLNIPGSFAWINLKLIRLKSEIADKIKKMIPYAVLILELHPGMKSTVLNILFRFPKLRTKLKRLKAESKSKQLKGFRQTVLSDIAEYFIRQSTIQQLLTKILSIICRVERRLQTLVIKNTVNKVGNIPIKNNQKQGMTSMTPQARRIYYDLVKAFTEKRNEDI